MQRHRALVAVLIALAPIVLSGCSDSDDDTITLRVADWLPADHIVVREGIDPWMKRVTELTDGQVQFEYYPAEQLGPATDLFKLTRSGVADIGFVNAAYVPETLSLSSVAGLPGLAESSCANSLGYERLLGPDGVVGQHEYEQEGLHPLLVSATSAYEVFTADRSVTTPEDMAGLTIALSGGAMARMADQVEAAPVTMGAPERYDAMRKGTIDATILGFATAPTYSMQEVVGYATVGANLGSSASAYSISNRRWDDLPEDVQDAMGQASTEMTRRLCRALDDQDQVSRQVMADAGVRLHELTAAERQAFTDALAPVAEAWLTRDLPPEKREYGEQAIEDYLAGAASADQEAQQ